VNEVEKKAFRMTVVFGPIGGKKGWQGGGALGIASLEFCYRSEAK